MGRKQQEWTILPENYVSFDETLKRIEKSADEIPKEERIKIGREMNHKALIKNGYILVKQC